MSILKLEITDFNEEDKPREDWLFLGYSLSGTTPTLTLSGESSFQLVSTSDIGVPGDRKSVV
jgi:hypothetical protein